MTLKDSIDEQLAILGLLQLTPGQVECLNDLSRIREAVAMLDDLQARCGVSIDLQEGKELDTNFQSEDEAREEAAKQALQCDAVCLTEMATDGRSRDTNEYRVVTFSGADAVLAAACHPQAIAYWVSGEEL